MNAGGGERSELIQGLWPDKALYGATLLSITALLGIIHGAALSLLDITVSEEGSLPGFLTNYPPELVLLFSLTAGVLGWLALSRQDTRLALAGCVAGILSFSLLGLGSALSVIALVFVFLSRREGEDASEETAELTTEMWPDKALAASVVVLVAGVVTIGWGYALAQGAVQFEGYTDDPVAFGWIAMGLGLLALLSALLLYRQRSPLLAALGCLGIVFALGLYVLGPILALAGLVLIWQAWREDEFVTAS